MSVTAWALDFHRRREGIFFEANRRPICFRRRLGEYRDVDKHVNTAERSESFPL